MATSTAASAQESGSSLRPGDRLPTFVLPDEFGQPLTYPQPGRTIVVVPFRGDWCSYCNGQLAMYARAWDVFVSRAVDVVAISVDRVERNLAMARKLLLPFPVLSDSTGELFRLFGAWDEAHRIALPSVFVADGSGVVRYAYVGADFADRPDEGSTLAAIDSARAADRPEAAPPRVRERDVGEPIPAPADGGDPGKSLHDLQQYFGGVYFATVALKGRLAAGGSQDAVREVGRYQLMVKEFLDAIHETDRLRSAVRDG